MAAGPGAGRRAGVDRPRDGLQPAAERGAGPVLHGPEHVRRARSGRRPRRQRRGRPDGHRRWRSGTGGQQPAQRRRHERRGAAPARLARQPDRRVRLPLPPDGQPRPRGRPPVCRLQVQPALGQLQVHLQARRRAESRGLDRDNELLQPALLRSLGRRRAQDHCAGGDRASTSSTATRIYSRPAPAGEARTPSTRARARSSSTRLGRFARSARTSAPTAGRSPGASTSSTSAARRSAHSCASTRFPGCSTSSTTARPRRR